MGDGAAPGTSPSQKKRRRARLRKAGIDLSALPAGYISAPTPDRVDMVARGLVSPDVGLADTSRRVRWVTERVRRLGESSFDALSRQELIQLVRLPVAVGQLEALARELYRRGDVGLPLALICERPDCPSSVLERTVIAGAPRAVAAAIVQLYERHGRVPVDLVGLRVEHRLRLAATLPASVVAVLVTDPSRAVRRVLARRPLGFAPSMLLATDADPEVRLVLARHTVDGRVLEWLRGDFEERVRLAVRHQGDLLLRGCWRPSQLRER